MKDELTENGWGDDAWLLKGGDNGACARAAEMVLAGALLPPLKRFYLARYLNSAHISRMILPDFLMIQHYLRWYSDWNHASRCILPGDQFRVYVAIQFVVDIIVADVFQGSAASGAFETLHVKILVLDSHEDASAERERERKKE